MFYEVGVGKKFLIHSQIMEDLNEKTHNFNIINIKILFLSKTKKKKKKFAKTTHRLEKVVLTCITM